MTEQAEHQGTTTSNGAGWIGLIGLALIVVGLLGAVLMWSEMSSGGFDTPDYPTAEKWRAVLTALAVSGLGAVTCAVGEVASRLPRRD